MSVRWGLSATLLADPEDILRFAAYHAALGAHRLYLYLDDPGSAAYDRLKAHPTVRVTRCDAAHWDTLAGRRPAKHQVRQCLNATHAYTRRAEVDWMIHIDVDEFLVPQATTIADALAQAKGDAVRARPMELLADGDGTAFKAFIPPGPQRQQIVRALYPTYGHALRGGFLSHVAGKVFVRTGLGPLDIRIHDVFGDGAQRVTARDSNKIALAHCHARTWSEWSQHFAYRLERGAYRAELKPAPHATVSLHALLSEIAASDGEVGLHAFFDEVIADTASLRGRLEAHGLLRHVALGLDAHRAAEFTE
ncbi:MAG: glycosyltransferase family 2 protein [Pseudomonadota bacterium]